MGNIRLGAFVVTGANDYDMTHSLSMDGVDAIGGWMVSLGPHDRAGCGYVPLTGRYRRYHGVLQLPATGEELDEVAGVACSGTQRDDVFTVVQHQTLRPSETQPLVYQVYVASVCLVR